MMTSCWTKWNFSFDLQGWNLRRVWWLSCGSECDGFSNYLLDGATCWEFCRNKWNNFCVVAAVQVIHVLITILTLIISPNWQILHFLLKASALCFEIFKIYILSVTWLKNMCVSLIVEIPSQWSLGGKGTKRSHGVIITANYIWHVTRKKEPPQYAVVILRLLVEPKM